MDGLDDFMMTRPPTAARPFLGLTFLVVEDSRFACEAIRLLCLRSGARLRRADRIAHARQHLRVYRPSVVIVDIGLPDGSGLDLIAEIDRMPPRIDVLIGMSGDDTQEPAARAAGADNFLCKPIDSLGAFQSLILGHLPAERRPRGPFEVSTETVAPDRVALRDDLLHVRAVLDDIPGADERLDYAAQFVGGLAQAAQDSMLGRAAEALAEQRMRGAPCTDEVERLAGILDDRLGSVSPV